mgnify:CR=1 FL=1
MTASRPLPDLAAAIARADERRLSVREAVAGRTVVLITHDKTIARQAARSINILDGKVSEVEV